MAYDGPCHLVFCLEATSWRFPQVRVAYVPVVEGSVQRAACGLVIDGGLEFSELETNEHPSALDS